MYDLFLAGYKPDLHWCSCGEALNPVFGVLKQVGRFPNHDPGQKRAWSSA